MNNVFAGISLDLVATIFFAAISLLLIISNIRLRARNKKIVLRLAQESIDKNIIIEKMSEEIKSKENSSIEKTDGFLKFISESRDWAFQYIEDVQEALAVFRDKVEPKLRYANTYGTAAGKSPHLDIIEEITLAYIDLKKVMPEDDRDKPSK